MGVGTARVSPSVRTIVDRVSEARDGAGPSREAIAEVAALIARRFAPRRIVLFGSRADGIATADSDVDLMVVMETARRPLAEAVRIHRAIALAWSFPLDVLVRTPEQIRVGLSEGDFFVRDVMAKGVTLCEAGDA